MMQRVRARVHAADGTRRGRPGTAIVVSSVIAILLIGSAALAGGHLQPSATDVQPVLAFADASDTGGTSILTRTGGMVVLALEAAELEPGNAYTVWWVVFNNPAGCSGDCGEDDILNEDGSLNEAGIVAAQIGVGHATGNIARSDGTTEFGGRLRQNDTSSDHQILFPAGFTGEGLMTASGLDAEVHLVVQDHGKARGGKQLANQLAEFQFGCTPGCEDVQFAVHK